MATAVNRKEEKHVGKIRTRFNEEKTAAAASVLLAEAGGRMSRLRLLKLLYYADRACWDVCLRPITGDKYVAMPLGPVLSMTYNIICDQEEIDRTDEDHEGFQPDHVGPWFQATKFSPKCHVVLRGEPNLSPLSRFEIDILKRVFHENRGLSDWGLVDKIHRLPEYDDPRGSSQPIRPERILKALEKTQDEIEEALEESREREQVAQFFEA